MKQGSLLRHRALEKTIRTLDLSVESNILCGFSLTIFAAYSYFSIAATNTYCNMGSCARCLHVRPTYFILNKFSPFRSDMRSPKWWTILSYNYNFAAYLALTYFIFRQARMHLVCAINFIAYENRTNIVLLI